MARGRTGGGMAGDTNFFWNDYDEPDTVEVPCPRNTRLPGIWLSGSDADR